MSNIHDLSITQLFGIHSFVRSSFLCLSLLWSLILYFYHMVVFTCTFLCNREFVQFIFPSGKDGNRTPSCWNSSKYWHPALPMKPGEHRQPLQSGKTEGRLCFLNLLACDWTEQKSLFTATNKNAFCPLQEKGGQIYIRHVLSLETLTC